MNNKTYFFYDLETSGLSPKEDRIMQFAGQRTDLDFHEIGEPVNLLVKLADDTLPSPAAINTTHITPQSTQADGLTEAELCRYLTEEIFTPGTIALGYNSVRFDDEHMRHLFWRNFYDPYKWQWEDGRSRWDMLDVVRFTRALRPEGINWPVTENGKPTNRLELLTKMNGISHESAHDALSDVTALIDVTRLIRSKQPKLFEYLFKMRDKKLVQKLVNLEDKQPFVYASGRYGTGHNFTTVAFPIAPARNGNILVFDLRYNLDELLAEPERESFYPIVKTLCYNRCPAVAPLKVLDVEDGWEKIELKKEEVDKNLAALLAHPEFVEKMRSREEGKPDFPKAVDPESALYDSFVPEADSARVAAVRNANADELADFHPDFADERLPELLLHYKAKNFPTSLSETEQKEWEAYRRARLERQAPGFLVELQSLSEKGMDDFLVEELMLWYQSLAD